MNAYFGYCRECEEETWGHWATVDPLHIIACNQCGTAFDLTEEEIEELKK